MKAATTHHKCIPGHGLDTSTAIRWRAISAHTPQRAPSAPRCTEYAGAAPRLTAPLAASKHVISIEPAPLYDPDQGVRVSNVRRVLLIDTDSATAQALSALLMPEAEVTHVTTLVEARRMLVSEIYSLVVIDPGLPDGDGGTLVEMLSATPVLVYAAHQPKWRAPAAFLPKPWTSPRQLWHTISRMLGVPASMSAGD